MNRSAESSLEGMPEEARGLNARQLLVRLPVLIACCMTVVFPLFLGGMIPGAIELVQVFSFLGAGFFVWHLARPTAERKVALALGRGAEIFSLCALVFSVVALFQLIPLPLSVLEIFSGRAAEVYSATGAAHGHLSLEHYTTRRSLTWFVALSFLTALIVALPRVSTGQETFHEESKTSRRRKRVILLEVDYVSSSLLKALIFAGLLCALIGISHQLFGWKELFGMLALDRTDGRAHFPFANPNHLAVMMEITTLLAAGKLFRVLEVKNFPPAKRNRETAYYSLTLVLALSAVMLSASRLGIILTLCGLFLFLVYVYTQRGRGLFKRTRREPSLKPARLSLEQRLLWGLGITCVVLLVLAIVVAMLGESGRGLVQERFAEGVATGIDRARRSFVSSSFDALPTYWLFGAGLGCWHLAVAPFISEDIAHFRLDYAHNEYLQLFIEAGIFGLLAAIVALAVSAKTAYSVWQNHVIYAARVHTLSLVLALALPLAHAVFDFPFHIPALALCFALVLALLFRLEAVK